MEILYHYTNLDAFYSIFKYKKLWLSGAHNLNDHQEIQWTAIKVQQTLQRLSTPDNSKFANELWEVMNINKPTPYICSLSTKSDLLSQWRAYTNDGKGVAIGFRKDLPPQTTKFPATTLSKKDSITTLPVVYKNTAQDKTIEQIIAEYLKNRTNQPTETEGLAIDTAYLLNGLSTIFKNEAFHEESEWRIIHTPVIIGDKKTNKTIIYSGMSDIKHRISNGKLITYFEFDFSEKISNNIICDLVLGPKSQVTSYDLDLFLSLNGFRRLNFRRSAASYR